MMRSMWIVVAAAITAVGCGTVREEDDAPPGGNATARRQALLVAGEEPNVVQAQRYVSQGSQAMRAGVGGDCTETGPAGCLSGLCVKLTRGRLAPRTCVNACESDTDCPASQVCAQLSATDNLWGCLPRRPLPQTATDEGATP